MAQRRSANHGGVEFVVGSCLDQRVFSAAGFSGLPPSPPSTKTNIFKIAVIGVQTPVEYSFV